MNKKRLFLLALPLLLCCHGKAQTDVSTKDSVFSFVRHASKMKCGNKSMSFSERAIFSFLMEDEANHSTNTIVYGKFSPAATITCSKSRKKKAIVKIDFGLGKWALYDKSDNQICMYDLKANSLSILRLLNTVCPDDDTIKAFYNSQK